MLRLEENKTLTVDHFNKDYCLGHPTQEAGNILIALFVTQET